MVLSIGPNTKEHYNDPIVVSLSFYHKFWKRITSATEFCWNLLVILIADGTLKIVITVAQPTCIHTVSFYTLKWEMFFNKFAVPVLKFEKKTSVILLLLNM